MTKLPERDTRTTPELLQGIAEESLTLVRQEAELARHELRRTLTTWAASLAGLLVAGAFGLVALVFLGLAAESLLEAVLPDWAARGLVGLAALTVTAGALATARAAPRPPRAALDETGRSLKDDVLWARAHTTH